MVEVTDSILFLILFTYVPSDSVVEAIRYLTSVSEYKLPTQNISGEPSPLNLNAFISR